MADHEHALATLLGKLGQLDGIVRGQCHRFFDQDVFAGLQGLAGEIVMSRRARGDDDAIDDGVLEEIIEPNGGAQMRE